MPWYSQESEILAGSLGYLNIINWRLSGYYRSHIIVYADLITLLQNDYETTLGSIISAGCMCIMDDMLNMETGEFIYSYYFDNSKIRGYNYLTKDW